MTGTYETVHANGFDFEVLAAGRGDRLALCLHGFPEHAQSWRYQIPILVSLGYRVWAPNQRGYGNTMPRPLDVASYDTAMLLDDITALIDASGAKTVTLLAHDWGGALAWIYAWRPARPIERLIIMNAPHPVPFSRALRTSRAQRRRSWYMRFFQVPALPEAFLGWNRAAAIGALFHNTSTCPENFPAEILSVYRENAARPGALRAMLNWYRAAPEGMRAQMRLGVPQIEIPTLVIWGEDDRALGKETIAGAEKLVNDYRIEFLPGVSHWVQQDAPERVNELLREFLAPLR